ncbi:MAG: proprotein convertase P-domain-containing protein [Leptospiraceae bacterium]|nr:proprotein convertase P-domain-containing protein [Leptospiraceae bacterium]
MSCGNYSGWVFGSARHLGESPVGQWTLRVADRRIGTGDSTGRSNGGIFYSWRIKFYGRANYNKIHWEENKCIRV